MPKIQLSSRSGNIQGVTISTYKLDQSFLEDDQKKNKHINWIKHQTGVRIFDETPIGIRTLGEIEDPSSLKLTFKSTELLEPPFENTSAISSIISGLLKENFLLKHEQFENKNIFVVSRDQYDSFLLLKCFEFNVEVFPSGDFLIHFLPVSRIVSALKPVSYSYFENLLLQRKQDQFPEDLTFNLVNQNRFYRSKFDLMNSDSLTKLKNTLTEESNFSASYDYHFLAGYDTELFGKLNENAQKELEASAKFIYTILKEVQLPDSFNLAPSPFFEVEKSNPLLSKNLRVGMLETPISIHSANTTQYGLRIEFNIRQEEVIHVDFLKNIDAFKKEKIINAKKPFVVNGNPNEYKGNTKLPNFFLEGEPAYSLVGKQSQAFYNGIYKPAWKGIIVPVLLNDDDISNFQELIKKFNPKQSDFQILPETIIKETKEDPRTISELIRDEIIPKIEKIKGKFLIAIFSKFKMPNDTFKYIRRYEKQIFNGLANDSSKQGDIVLSNFVCKCLEKLGGQVAAIDNTFLDESGIFLGIDLGHSTHGEERKSNLAGVTFDCHGNLLGKFMVPDLDRKENLTKIGLDLLLSGLKRKMSNKFPRALKHVVIHRDGKLHSGDLVLLKESISTNWGDCEIDVVEVIKSGYPLVLERNQDKKLAVPESGSFYVDTKNKYAILITNDQVRERNKTVNPIIIKHKMGSLDFHKIVEQVYWFTKIHTQGIHNPTRLPATTLKANNIVSTSRKTHIPTYLG